MSDATDAPTPKPTTFPTTYDTNITSSQLATSILLYGGIGLLCVIAHALLRRYARVFYSPRANSVPRSRAAPEVPRAAWRWFLPLLHPRTDDMILKYVGLDAYVTIRFLALGAKLFAVLAPLGMIVLAPVYASQGDRNNLSGVIFSDIDRLTLQYVSGGAGVGTPVMWLPCVFVYVFTGVGLLLLHREYRRIVPLQRRFLLYKHQATYTVLVERIPVELTSRKALTRFFESIFPGTVERVDLVPISDTTQRLKDAVSARATARERLERAMLLEHQNNRRGKQHADAGGSGSGSANGSGSGNAAKSGSSLLPSPRLRFGGHVSTAGAEEHATHSNTTETQADSRDTNATASANANTSGNAEDGFDAAAAGGEELDWRHTSVAFDASKSWMGARGLCNGWLCLLLGQGRKVQTVPHYAQRLNELNAEVARLQAAVRAEVYDEPDAAYKFGASPHSAPDAARSQSQSEAAGPDEPETAWRFSATQQDKLEEADFLLGPHPYGRPWNGKSAAFVTFRDKTASTSVSRCMRSEANDFDVHPAPQPSDVNWQRLACHPTLIATARVAVLCLNTLLLLLFGVLTSTISVTTNLPSLRERWAALDEYLQDNAWAAELLGQVAPLLLVITFALVPPILNLILQLRCELSDSAQENSFFCSYAVFLVAQLFLFFQISGALVGVLASSFDNPREFVNLLAQMIPANATFFMQFLTVRALWVLPGAELLRVGPLAVALLVRPALCGVARTPREKRDDTCGCRTLGVSGDAWHGSINAQFLLSLCIGVTYSVLAPLVLVFALVYFCVAVLVYRNQLLYVYVKKFESGGSNWTNMGIAYLLAFGLLQLTMLGVFALSEAPAQSVLMLPPLLATLAYAVFLWTLYDETTAFVSLSDARRFDIRCLADSEYRRQRPLNYALPALADPAEIEPASVSEMLSALDRLRLGHSHRAQRGSAAVGGSGDRAAEADVHEEAHAPAGDAAFEIRGARWRYMLFEDEDAQSAETASAADFAPESPAIGSGAIGGSAASGIDAAGDVEEGQEAPDSVDSTDARRFDMDIQ